ncbi:MAG: PAS domain-containing protein, partial [Methanomassiliicoccales archaeon]
MSPVRVTKQDQGILALIAISTAAIFILDISTKVGMAIGLLYVLPILLTLWLSNWRIPATITVIMVVIAIAGFFMKPEGDWSFGLVNRPLIVLVVGMTGVLCARQVWSRIRLHESNAFNTRLLTESDQIVIKMDIGGNVVLFNRGAVEFTGLSVEEVLGKNLVEILAQGNSSMNAVWTAASNALGTAVEIPLKTKDGSIRHLSFRLLTMEADNEVGMLLLGQDITARAKAEIELSDGKRFLERMLGASPSEVTIYEIGSGHILYQNRALASVLGYPLEQVQAMGEAALTQTVFPDDALLLQEQCQRLLRAQDGEVLEVDYRLRAFNGATHWFHSNCLVFTRDVDHRPLLAMRVAYDITEMRLIQERLSEEVRDRI